MTDLKPDKTLYNTDMRKATIIGLKGSVKVASSKELLAFDIARYSFQSTAGFRAPELEGSQGVVNMHKSLAYNCGKIIEAVTHKSDYDQQEISQIIKKLTNAKPEARISLPEAISEIKKIGDDSYRKNIIFSHYISKVKDRLENKKSAISINEDIEKTKKLFITLNSTSSDPSKSKDLKTEDLFKKIDDFLAPGNTKQVMAIFGIPGSGKSIALQLKFIQAVNAWQPGKPLPVYFNLANGLDLDQIVRTLNAELDTNLTLKSLDGQHLYIDSFNEGPGIEHNRETLIKEYFRKLGTPKILITCRTEYLQGSSYEWFSPESKELETCYIAPINYNGHQDLSNMVEKYVCYFKQLQHTSQDYLNRLKELQLADLINTGFMFVVVMEVLFQLQDKKEGRVNYVDIYAYYTTHYQNSQIAKLKNQAQKNRLKEMILSSKSNQQLDLCSFATELGKHLACQMHLLGHSRLGESDKLFAALGYDNSLLLKHQNIIHLLKLLPVKIVTAHSGKRLISNQEVKIGFIDETIKNYYLLEAIKSEIVREGKSLILESKSIVQDSELVKLIALAMTDNPQLTASFLKAIENSKHDKSTSSIIYASNSITLLVAAKHSFSGCNLRNIAVKGANIANGIFQNANLDNADLSGVDMSNVDLTGASLNGANLIGVNFSLLPDLVGHTDSVRSISFSSDGKFLASGSQDKTIKIWDTSNYQCLETLVGHTNWVTSVSFSPDGKFLASGAIYNAIKIWNPSTGECLQTINEQNYMYQRVNSVSFSPDGKFLASGSSDKTIKIWNPSSGECLLTLNGHTGEVLSVSFSPDSKLLASGSQDNTIKIWNLSTGECLQTLNEHTKDVKTVSFSPDGKFLASGARYEDSTIKIWNPSTGECLRTLVGHSSVESVSFSPDGKSLASGSYDQTIKIWNPSTGECLQTLNGHISVIECISFSPDGKFLASGSGLGVNTIKIWSSSTRECLQILKEHTDPVYSTSFSLDGKLLASRSQDKIKISNSSTGECLRTLDGHTGPIKSVSFSPDGKSLASRSQDKTIKIWSPSTGECLNTLNGHTSWVESVSFSPDGKLLASGSQDMTIKIWNIRTGECLQTLNGHTTAVFSVSFSPDGKFLASGSAEKQLELVLRMPSLSELVNDPSKEQTKAIEGVGFSPDGQVLVKGSSEIKIWNTSSGECLHTLCGHLDHVLSVSFSPNGKFLASGADLNDKTIQIWNPSTGERVQTLKGHTDGVFIAIFSPDSKFLASGSMDHTIKIWNPSIGECMHTLNGHTGWVYSVSFSPDGRFLASGSADKTIKIFEAINDAWLLKRNMASTPSPLLADGATLKQTKISKNNGLVLEQKGADTTSSVSDNTIHQIEHHRDTSSKSNSTASLLSQAFLEKFIAYQQIQDTKLVRLKMPMIDLSGIVAECRSSSCCQTFTITKIIYDNPLLNSPALFAQISQILGPNQALELSNK